MKSDFFGDLGSFVETSDVYTSRRKELVKLVRDQFPQFKDGIIILFGALEREGERFRQDKTFYYYTNIIEPGTVLVVDFLEKTTLYIPNCYQKRAQWMTLPAALVNSDAKALGVDSIELLGDKCSGYGLNPYFSADEYTHMIALIKNVIGRGGSLFTTVPNNGYEYLNTRFMIERLEKFIPNLYKSVVDISAVVANSRRSKNLSEIERMYRAIKITELAHEGAIEMIRPGISESEVQASLEYMMTASCARPAFPSIVASGKNSTVLHYNENSGILEDGDLLVIDIGAEFNGYCADLTRTYPVSGSFSERQRELYTVVLKTQEYIASLAKPGIWLKNKDKTEQSLHHLAVKFLAKHGYEKYFPHGIGHFLGLDVHDVGDYNVPLREGDVITIEPGIYIPQENIGIRIEDNYWITKDGAFCLSEGLPKDIEDIETMVQQSISDAQQESTDEYLNNEEFDDEEDDLN